MLTGNLIAFVMSVVTVICTWLEGGLGAPGVLWFPIVPILAMLIAGRRTGIVWTTFNVVALLGFYFLRRFGYSPVVGIDLDTMALLHLSLVGLMGGEMRLESTFGAGSRFTFTVRLGTTSAAAERDQPELGGRRVLVVDANPISRTHVTNQLRCRGADAGDLRCGVACRTVPCPRSLCRLGHATACERRSDVRGVRLRRTQAGEACDPNRSARQGPRAAGGRRILSRGAFPADPRALLSCFPDPAAVTHPFHELRPFGSGADLGGTILRADIHRTGTVLSLRYVLRAPAGRWRAPEPRPKAVRADGLWEHSCFEAFVAPAGGAAYWEVNLSPSGDWNVYRFDGYRGGMRPELRATVPAIRLDRASCGTLTLRARLDLAGLTELRTRPFDAGLAAVLESTDGALAYWALAHATPKPDFHRRETFVVRLEPEEPA